MDVDKDQLRIEFTKQWEKHYKLECLIERGFKRQQCSSCKRNFWSTSERKQCADPSCIGYQFIGDTPVKKKLGYVDTWKVIEKYFTSKGHGYVKPYPTVARWRDDLYFTIASINDFQPYVVNGELDPPHNPLIVPQPCIRFGDISNVGVSGRHYTNFVMIGQHAFNTSKTGLFYWKNEAIEHDIAYLKQLGIPEDELVFMEDVWAGGGNFGPSMEYFVRGLELGNCVFMQYENTPTGNRELKTKVIDMGAGLSRLAWMTTGDPTSYEVVFGDVIQKMKKQTGVEVDRNLFLKYAKISGSLNEDEVEDLEAEKTRVAKMLGTSKEGLFSQLERLQSIYATADHTCTLLFTVTDGMLPSNAGGGYNLRMVLRRVFGFENEFGFEFDYAEILKGHAKHLDYIFPHLKDGVDTTISVIEEERKRYSATKEKAKGKVLSIISKSNGKVKADDLFTLYKSHGIPPEYVTEIAKEQKASVEVPGNFYKAVREKDETTAIEDSSTKIDVDGLPKTEQAYYTDKEEFDATVIAILNKKYVVLDRTGFYPEGGGQVSDRGSLNGVEVKYVGKQAGIAYHEVADVSKFKKGQKVSGKVDLNRRKTITRHHSVTHLVTAACRQVLGRHAWQGGSHKDEERAHLDITHYKKITPEELNKIELLVNDFISRNMPIKIEVLPRVTAEQKYGFTLYQGGAVPGKELRVVSMGDVDSEACGGTHHMLKTTGEIGCFKIVRRESIQDGIERLTYKCGDVAVRYIQEREAMLHTSATMLSVGDNELPKAVERFFSEWKEQRKKIELLQNKLVEEETHELIEHCKEKVMMKILDVDSEILKKIASAVVASESSAVVLMNNQGNLIVACGGKSKYKANELLKKVLAKLGGNGGGNEKIASGKALKVEMVELN
ncbi:MAG: alanine--tRNA ligase [Candidatus Micrarchaeota archaeon]|nr:alanine--tRNA ligase [Candidatus Micrarchaeota archaeon]